MHYYMLFIAYWVKLVNLQLLAKTTHLSQKKVNTRLTKVFMAFFALAKRLLTSATLDLITGQTCKPLPKRRYVRKITNCYRWKTKLQCINVEKKNAKKSISSRVFNSLNFYVYKHWRICGTMTEDDIQPSFEKNGDDYVSACAILQFRSVWCVQMSDSPEQHYSEQIRFILLCSLQKQTFEYHQRCNAHDYT